jgi:hypothetical protein
LNEGSSSDLPKSPLGQNEVSGFATGDEVYGATNEHFTGADAEYALSSAGRMGQKPKILNFIEGTAFVRRSSIDLDLIFSLQYQRTVNRDNTVSIQNLRLQIEPVRPESANDYAVSLYSELEPSRPISQSLTVAPMSWA